MTDEALRARSAREVFEDHLRLAAEHRFAEDLARNVSPSCVVLERRGVFRGREGVRELARWLEDELPGARYVYTNRMVEGRMAFLEWTAQIEGVRVCDGADSFLIEQGWIVAQTIHYTLEPVDGEADPPARP
ncbi:nuclear transport factor 2 family protein [Micromonospora echinofusca]|uniref:SnoaL-like domain-containing protein n=1 Tax=Micromonospora echinofusca TaxID=47858 RepID=A0A1C5GBF5_MICEH|nr:nuclear transport factor 2 family protein [Micromonospora echinofusca]SCG16872.1 SnoaL-like domain-containing protein [Micromonospora echinofusca]